MKLELFCTCGAVWTLEVKLPFYVRAIRAAWHAEHSGPGHSPCTEVTAAMARVRKAKEKKEL